MKVFIKKLWPLLTLIVVLASLIIFYAVTLTRDNNLNITETNLCDDAKISGGVGSKMAFDNSALTVWSLTNQGSETVITFDKSQEVNTLLLNENGFNIRKFSIYYDNVGEWTLCYRQNEIGINRLATFYTVKTPALKIVIDEFKNIARITDIKAYNIAPRERTSPLRVTAYITPGSLNDYNPETGESKIIDKNSFDVITDVQFIAYGRFNQDGSVYKEKDADNLVYLKDMIGNRDVNIFITVFPPAGASMANMLRDNMDRCIASIVEMVLAANVGGADFDWEYPANAQEYALYSEFLTKLGKELDKHGKELSVALSPWGIKLSQEAIDSIDQLQIMAYDLFDHNGDNNSYAGSTENCISYMLDMGFTKEQLNLGVSYYGRPSDASGKWYNFNDPSFTQDEYIMNERGVYFNTPTTLRDKTVYALLRGLGGIMTFAQDEDVPMSNPLSLTAQIGKAKDFFSIVR